MTPAEIWQNGQVVNQVCYKRIHQGKLNGKDIIVSDSSRFDRKLLGCHIGGEYYAPGSSVTLDGGEIVKSVRDVRAPERSS